MKISTVLEIILNAIIYIAFCLITGVVIMAAMSESVVACPDPDKPSVYAEAAFGINRQNPDLSGTLSKQRNLGKAAVGVDYKNLFLELEHVSDVQLKDNGMDTLWGGIRVRW
jgi:hypothetical protein